MTTESIRIDDRYEGFPGIAIGGFSGGLLARRIGSEAAVAFHRPIPTEHALEIVETGDAVELQVDDEVAATATPAAVDVDLPAPVTLEDAKVATQSYLGHDTHPFPTCFTCGPDRREGDGLRVFPAPVADEPVGGPPDAGGPLVAAAWTPHPDHAGSDGTLPAEIVWASVDCSSIWPVIEAAAPDSSDHVVTGRLALRLDAPIRAGEPHVVAAWPLAPEPSRQSAAAVIWDDDGTVKAIAHHTLVVTEWGVPLGVARWDNQE